MFALANSLAATVTERVSGLAAVYLFGSRAREDAGQDGDIDLAVLGLDRLDSVERWKLQEDLAAQAHQNVDLVDLRQASTVMRVQVLRNGRLLADLQPDVRTAFEAFDLLSGAGLYPRESAERLRRMVGFRNVAVHEYQALNLDIVGEIIRSHAGEDAFLELACIAFQRIPRGRSMAHVKLRQPEALFC